MEVPRPLKHLVQKVMRGFYPCEHVIVVDLLIRRVVLKEDEMIELLRFEKKQLRTTLALLKNDKLIKFKLRMETGLDGKAFRQNYYYINYKDFVNVVKYKLDHVRKKFELIDRDNTSRASFICSYCRKSFTDLEVDMLLDIATGELKCTHCGSDVAEDPNHLPKADSRKMLAKFNETMEPLYMLLKEIEDIRLTSELLDPDIDSRTEKSSNNDYDASFSSGKWSDKNKGLNPFIMNNNLNNFNVKIEDNDTSLVTNQPKKEQPIWMMESTIAGASTVDGGKSKLSNGSTNVRPLIDTIDLPTNSELSTEEAKEILEVLLLNEKPDDYRWAKICEYFGFEPSEELLNVKLEIEEIDSTFSPLNLPCVHVNGSLIPIAKINDKHIVQMKEYEKQEYIHIAQKIYMEVFDM
ncbi:hypothetical protein NH340_JMT03133 [Sarcoptes scabiei]|nr:hypothetical protein NH340_JMT03133 [Sarcoptes scabiei]